VASTIQLRCVVPDMKDSTLMRRFAAVIGWILYCFGWFRIISITPRREPLSFALFFTAAAIMLFVTAHSWVAHNRRLAAHGRRGNMTRYTPPCYTRDYLGRELVFAPEIASAREVSLSILDGHKMYLITPEIEEETGREALVAAGEKDEE